MVKYPAGCGRKNIGPLMLSLEKDITVLYREYKRTRMVKELGLLHRTQAPARASTVSAMQLTAH
jgi:hypothetical protein